MHSDDESIEIDVPYFAPTWVDSDSESQGGNEYGDY